MANNTDNRKKSARNWCILLFGLVIMAFGIAFSIKGDLGTSPISSLPYVSSLIVDLTVGECTIIIMQILLLRKNYDPIQLLQLPIAIFFGYMTDIALLCIEPIECATYAMSWYCCIIGLTYSHS